MTRPVPAPRRSTPTRRPPAKLTPNRWPWPTRTSRTRRHESPASLGGSAPGPRRRRSWRRTRLCPRTFRVWFLDGGFNPLSPPRWHRRGTAERLARKPKAWQLQLGIDESPPDPEVSWAGTTLGIIAAMKRAGWDKAAAYHAMEFCPDAKGTLWYCWAAVEHKDLFDHCWDIAYDNPRDGQPARAVTFVSYPADRAKVLQAIEDNPDISARGLRDLKPLTGLKVHNRIKAAVDALIEEDRVTRRVADRRYGRYAYRALPVPLDPDRPDSDTDGDAELMHRLEVKQFLDSIPADFLD
jgi:hypothetical protein